MLLPKLLADFFKKNANFLVLGALGVEKEGDYPHFSDIADVFVDTTVFAYDFAKLHNSAAI